MKNIIVTAVFVTALFAFTDCATAKKGTDEGKPLQETENFEQINSDVFEGTWIGKDIYEKGYNPLIGISSYKENCYGTLTFSGNTVIIVEQRKDGRYPSTFQGTFTFDNRKITFQMTDVCSYFEWRHIVSPPNFALYYLINGNDLTLFWNLDQNMIGSKANLVFTRAEAMQERLRTADEFNSRGREFLNENEYDRAIADFSEAVKLSPDTYDYYDNRARAYFNKRDFDHAISDYDQMIRLRPDNYRAYLNRANAYHLNGNIDRAIADLESVLRINPNFPPAQQYLERLRKDRQ